MTETLGNAKNILLLRNVGLVNDRLIPNLEGIIDHLRQSRSSNNRVKTDRDATWSLIFLCFLCEKLDVLLDILLGVQAVMAAIAADVKVGHGSQIDVVLKMFLIKVNKYMELVKTKLLALLRKLENFLQKYIFGRCQASNFDPYSRNCNKSWNDDVTKNTMMDNR